jgi:hypothetical protein
MIGIGNTKAYDTYLSPLEYSGTNLGIIHEQLKMTGLLGGNVSAQHLFNIELAETKNPAGNVTSYVGSLEYGYGLHYRFRPVRKIQIFAGLQGDGLVGFIYNTRNGNNPVNAKVNFNFNLSGIAVYRFQIKKQPLQLRYQLNVPFAGIVFSPEFGQSYYEIGEGDSNNLIQFASLHNQWVIRNLLSVELPLNFCTVRLSYMNWIYETSVNSLDTRIISNSVYIGVSKYFHSVPGRKITKNNYQRVFE